MASSFTFNLENDPVPIVLMFKTMLEHALSNREHAETARSVQGSFSLVSTTDPQSLSIDINDGVISMEHGVSEHSKVIMHLDFNRMTEPGYKPKVVGLFKHPMFAYKVGKLLSFPPTNWADEAKRFWDVYSSTKGMPDTMKLIITNEGRELVFGEGPELVVITGNSKNLASLFSGSSVLINELMRGNLKMRGTLKHMTVLSGVSLRSMVGS
jgi:hypothetical protein